MSADWTAADYRRDVAEQTEEWNAMWRAEARDAADDWDGWEPETPDAEELWLDELDRRRREQEERR